MATRYIKRSDLTDDPTSREYVNTFERKAYSGLDGDEQYDEFFTREYWDRRKKRRKLRKEYKSQGISRKEARRRARLEAREEVPRVPLKTALKRSWTTFKKLTLLVPRNAYLGLVKLNYRGNANKIKNAQQTNTKLWKAIEDKWVQLGGNPDNLKNSMNIGWKKNPILCGVDCKNRVSQLTTTEIAQAKAELETDPKFSNAIDPLTQAGIMVGMAGTIIMTLDGVLTNAKMSKVQQGSLDEQIRVNDEALKMQSDQQNFENAQALKYIAQQTSPIAEIQEDPNLTPLEKAEAQAVINQAFDPIGEGYGQTKKTNPLMYVAVLGGIFLLMAMAGKMKRRTA
jgi:hypothetical protein